MPDAGRRIYRRYVAIGDSTTEGLDDPDGRGGYRGWANRFAEHVAAAQGGLLYANLAVRGRQTRRILDEQLEPALALEPDLATAVAGTNDLLRRRFDAARVGADLAAMLGALTGTGATVLTFTLPDMSAVAPLARRLASRARALNDAIRTAARDTGALLLDLDAYPMASDPRLWSIDRLHANSLGHERIGAALAWRLGLAGTDDSWTRPLAPEPQRSRVQRLAAEAAWIRQFLLPWLWRHARGRSSGDGRLPKRPRLEPVDLRRNPAGR